MRYFSAYGGWRGIAYSPLFLFALLITIINYNEWMTGNWSDQAISVIPNMLGFSLGTYLILFSLLTARLKTALDRTKSKSGVSNLETINSTFFHYIFVQVLALVFAFLGRSTILNDVRLTIFYANMQYDRIFVMADMSFSFFGTLLFYYSVLLILAAAQAVYRIALIVEPPHS